MKTGQYEIMDSFEDQTQQIDLESSGSYEIYIYDTELLQSEYDDPLNAVIFHYPSILTAEHVLMTAGQLAGVAQFFSSTFGEDAHCFQLEKGRFEIQKCGRLLLFVGDVTVEDSGDECDSARILLEDIMAVVNLYQGGLLAWLERVNDNEKFGKRLNAFLKVYFTQIFRPITQEIPTITECELDICRKIAKSCHEHTDVRGCSIVRNSQVLFSTFPTSVWRMINIFSDHRHLLPVRQTSFRLPLGMTLIRLSQKDQLWLHRSVRASDISNDSGESSTPDKKSLHVADSEEMEYDETIDEQQQQKSKRRKTRAEREATGRKRKWTRQRQQENVVDLIRKVVMTSKDEEEEDLEGQERMLSLCMQSVGNVDMTVAIYTKRIREIVVRDLWNIGLTKLDKLE